jgi:hypothetical protein
LERGGKGSALRRSDASKLPRTLAPWVVRAAQKTGNPFSSSSQGSHGSGRSPLPRPQACIRDAGERRLDTPDDFRRRLIVSSAAEAGRWTHPRAPWSLCPHGRVPWVSHPSEENLPSDPRATPPREAARSRRRAAPARGHSIACSWLGRDGPGSRAVPPVCHPPLAKAEGCRVTRSRRVGFAPPKGLAEGRVGGLASPKEAPEPLARRARPRGLAPGVWAAGSCQDPACQGGTRPVR